jgi:hypothetical protein
MFHLRFFKHFNIFRNLISHHHHLIIFCLFLFDYFAWCFLQEIVIKEFLSESYKGRIELRLVF